MKPNLNSRTFQFSINILNLLESIPKRSTTNVIIYQLAKSGTSVGANYRASRRARSDREFISKINIVLEEGDESDLLKEANELTAIFVAMLKTIKKRVNDK
jgi:four helix bundle protein